MQNQTHDNSFMEKAPLGKLMRMFSVPCIISFWWRRCITLLTRFLSPTRTISAHTAMRRIRSSSR